MSNTNITRYIAKRSTCSLAVALAICASSSLYAQTVTTPTAEDEIVISASRIQRSGFNAPTPTTIVGSDEIQARAAVTIGDILYQLPALRPTASNSFFPGNNGGNYTNLRGLGQARTLTLVDGQRFVATTNEGSVDTNVIPTSLVERVEIVTGGASAAWGSDAIAGVTNFILKKKIEGFTGTAQYGQSTRNDNQQQSVNLAWGTGFAEGRGQLLVAAEYSKLKNPIRAGDREWGRDAWGIVNGPTVNGIVTRIWSKGTQAVGMTDGGVIVATQTGSGQLSATSALRIANGGNGIQFGPGGTVLPFVYGTNITNTLMVGGSGQAFSVRQYLGVPLDRKNIYLKSTYDFTSNLRGFVQASYSDSQSYVNNQLSYFPNGTSALTIQRDNAYLAPTLKATMTTANIASFFMGRVFKEFGEYLLSGSINKVSRVAAGLDGDLGNSWNWNAYVTTGQTKYADFVVSNVREANMRAAVDTVIGPGGTPICRINSTVAADIAIVSAATYQGRGAAPGCVAANPFGEGSLTSAVAAYVLGRSQADSVIKQTAGAATLQGEPFSTWAGPVSLVGGFEYRKESVDQTADAVAQLSTTAFPAGGWQFSNRKPFAGNVTVKEYFAETVVPLLTDMPLARTLELNGAVRNTDYSIGFKVTTWKGGVTWSPVQGLLVRGTKSKDIRAPNLVELYTSPSSTIANTTDYGRAGNPSSTIPIISLGNPNLKPETATTQTVGITWEPPQIPGFHASVDIYKIYLKDNIALLGGGNTVASCYGAIGFPVTPANCALLTRDAGGALTSVTSTYLNQSFQRNKGMDIELSYGFPMAKLISSASGNLSLRVLGTYLDEQTINNLLTTVDNAGVLGNPHWRWTVGTTYNNGPLTLFLQGRYAESVILSPTPLASDVDINNLPSRSYLNGSVQYVMFDKGTQGRLALFLNVNNILDKNPPISPSGSLVPAQVGTFPDYDRVGRAFSLGVRFSYK